MTNNPYTTPQAVEPSNLAPADQNLELASRWARLGAFILDGLIMMVIALPVILLIMFFNVNSEEFASEEWLTQIDVTTNSLQFEAHYTTKIIPLIGLDDHHAAIDRTRLLVLYVY